MTITPERLRRRSDFLRVARDGRKWVAPGLILQIRPDSPTESGEPGESATFRIGFTVSRKVGNAVIRNRARRRLRAAVHDVMADHAAPCHDYVVIGRRLTVARPYEMLRHDLETALKRLGVWHEAKAGSGADRAASGNVIGGERMQTA